MAPLWLSSTSWRLPPQALAMACSSKVARLCTMPIQLPATCTTARWASMRTSWACCESSMRVEGSSRLPRICCHSSGRLVLVAGVVSGAADAVASSAAEGALAAWGELPVGGNDTAGVAGGAAPAGVGTATVVVATEGVGAGGVSAAGAADGTAGAGGALAGACAVLAAVAGVGRGAGCMAGVAAALGSVSASSPINSTSSQRRGCTLRRSCCSLPRRRACQCSKRCRPMRWASSGNWPRN